MDKIETENELNFKVTNKGNETLVDENCCTLLTISLNNNGDVFTTFLGAYNKDILKLLKKTQKTYYSNLLKRLKQNNTIEPTEEEIKQSEQKEQNKSEAKTETENKATTKPTEQTKAKKETKTNQTKKASNKTNSTKEKTNNEKK